MWARPAPVASRAARSGRGSLAIFYWPVAKVGPITLPAKLADEETVFSEDTSLIFKETKITRFIDRKRNVLVYLAMSHKLIEGAPANAISTVPVQPWGGK